MANERERERFLQTMFYDWRLMTCLMTFFRVATFPMQTSSFADLFDVL